MKSAAEVPPQGLKGKGEPEDFTPRDIAFSLACYLVVALGLGAVLAATMIGWLLVR